MFPVSSAVNSQSGDYSEQTGTLKWFFIEAAGMSVAIMRQPLGWLAHIGLFQFA
jgi:hypothetical protein